MRKILFITRNSHKVREANDILSKVGITVVQKSLDYPELQNDKLEMIAKFGAEWSMKKLNQELIVDDSGLFIDALGGFPGPYSSYVFDKIGNKGILKLMEGIANRSAVFKCVIGYCKPNEEALIFSGEVRGKIAEEIRGCHGFGYDPIFMIGERSFGEMEEKEKNRLSHRYKALMNLAQWLRIK